MFSRNPPKKPVSLFSSCSEEFLKIFSLQKFFNCFTTFNKALPRRDKLLRHDSQSLSLAAGGMACISETNLIIITALQIFKLPVFKTL
jgi:hypothetical protein